MARHLQFKPDPAPGKPKPKKLLREVNTLQVVPKTIETCEGRCCTILCIEDGALDNVQLHMEDLPEEMTLSIDGKDINTFGWRGDSAPQARILDPDEDHRSPAQIDVENEIIDHSLITRRMGGPFGSQGIIEQASWSHDGHGMRVELSIRIVPRTP